MKKFELTGEFVTNIFEKKLFRIRALVAFGNVEAGELGGYVEKEENLSDDGDAWVYGDAQVYGNARVYGNAHVSENAQVYEYAEVSGNAKVFGNAQVFGSAQVFGDAQVYGNARVYGNAHGYPATLIFSRSLASGRNTVPLLFSVRRTVSVVPAAASSGIWMRSGSRSRIPERARRSASI